MSRDTRELGERRGEEARRRRKTCACGRPMDRHSTKCRACWWEARRRAEAEQERAFVAKVLELRAFGRPQDAAAHELGMDADALRVKLSKLRAKGVDIPYWRA